MTESDYISFLGSLAKKHLIEQLAEVFKLLEDAEDGKSTLPYHRQIELIKAIGRFRFDDFDDEIQKM